MRDEPKGNADMDLNLKCCFIKRVIIGLMLWIHSTAVLYATTLDHDPKQDFDESMWRNPTVANALYGRGIAHARKGDHDAAIQDFTAAIDVDPTHRLAIYNRGIAHLKKADYGAAIADFDQAVRINPNAPDSYYMRGRAKFYHGDFAGAATDLEKVVQVRPRDLYLLLALYLAQSHNSGKADDSLTRLARDVDLIDWPGGVVSMFLGTTDPRAVLVAASDAESLRPRERQCEAYFYIGEYLLLRGSKSEAVEMFKASLASGISDFFESEGAKAELKRLGY
jgi:lipoprotein NlpI